MKHKTFATNYRNKKKNSCFTVSFYHLENAQQLVFPLFKIGSVCVMQLVQERVFAICYMHPILWSNNWLKLKEILVKLHLKFLYTLIAQNTVSTAAIKIKANLCVVVRKNWNKQKRNSFESHKFWSERGWDKKKSYTRRKGSKLSLQSDDDEILKMSYVLFEIFRFNSIYLTAHPQICGRKIAGKLCGYSRVTVTELKPAFSRYNHVGFLKQHPPISIVHIGCIKPWTIDQNSLPTQMGW